MKRLIPRFACVGWDGASLEDEKHLAAHGFCIVIEWLGLQVEIGLGRIRA